MNTSEYRKAYMANLKLEISNNNKNLVANKGNPALKQYTKWRTNYWNINI